MLSILLALLVALCVPEGAGGTRTYAVSAGNDPSRTYLNVPAGISGVPPGPSQLHSPEWYGIGADWRLFDHTPQNPEGTPLTDDQLLQAWRQDIDDHEEQYGFNMVRLAFSFKDSGGVAHNVFDDELDKILDLFSRNGIGVILDLHNWGDMPYFFGSSTWLTDWTAIAQRYKNDTRIIAYELFNEPFGPTDPPALNGINNWDPSVTGGGCGIPYSSVGKSVKEALAQCVDKIRATGDNHTIIYPPPWYFNVGDELSHPELFSNSTACRPNIVITFHEWFEDPTMQTESDFSAWWSKQESEMTLWERYFPIWIGEFGISTVANNIDFQQTINTVIINWAVANHVGFSLWTSTSSPTGLKQQWSLNDEALQASNYSSGITLTSLVAMAEAYDSSPNSPNWNPSCDLNKDGEVNLIDLVILATRYK